MKREAADILPVGKLPHTLLRELLGSPVRWPSELRVGPAIGEDACVLDLPGGVLVAATDPITLTGADVGAHAVVINANDVAVTGVRPRWFLASVLLPSGTRAAEVRALFAKLAEALDRVGAVLVGGHTEVTPVVNRTVVVGQMLGWATDRRFAATAGAKPGDRVVQVGEAPVEGAAVLAAELAARLEAKLERGLFERAQRAAVDPGLSVVEPALLAFELGARALHDPTEGGLAAGLHELAAAAGVVLRVDPEAVAWFEPGLAACRALGADPWATLASGTLLAAFPPDRAEAACHTLRAQGYTARAIAEVETGEGVTTREGLPIDWPERDEVARLLGA